jgi:hypothetical protein
MAGYIIGCRPFRSWQHQLLQSTLHMLQLGITSCAVSVMQEPAPMVLTWVMIGACLAATAKYTAQAQCWCLLAGLLLTTTALLLIYELLRIVEALYDVACFMCRPTKRQDEQEYSQVNE